MNGQSTIQDPRPFRNGWTFRTVRASTMFFYCWCIGVESRLGMLNFVAATIPNLPLTQNQRLMVSFVKGCPSNYMLEHQVTECNTKQQNALLFVRQPLSAVFPMCGSSPLLKEA
jgi:hypothetical protein